MDNPTPTAPHGPAPGLFATTQWTRILASRGEAPEAREALAESAPAPSPIPPTRPTNSVT